MQNKHLIIHGGSSEISKELMKLFKNEFNEFTIFCRNKKKVDEYIDEIKNESIRINIVEIDILDIEKNYLYIEKIKNNISGIIWISGATGNAEQEFLDSIEGEKNIRINFMNPILIINKIIPKMVLNANSFIVALTSVAGVRGRAKQLFYSSAKSGLISYLSGLRQKLDDKKINVITIIPGYIKTKAFEKDGWKAPSFLISSPKKAAKIIYKAVKSKKNIVYISFIWRIIMFFVAHIPEKIFKRLRF